MRRFFTTSARALAAPSREQLRKKAAKQIALQRLNAKKPAKSYPLYSEIPLALRYLRAIEVGKPAKSTTISVNSILVQEKGAPPVKGQVKLPYPLSDIGVLVFTNDPEQQEIAKSKNATLVGGNELIEKIKNKDPSVDLSQFEMCFATPDCSVQLTQIQKILGPKGLMPSIKKNTIVSDLNKALSESMGMLPFKQKHEYLSVPVGNTSFSDKQILENLIAVQDSVKDALSKVMAKKPTIIAKSTLHSTNGVGFVIEF